VKKCKNPNYGKCDNRPKSGRKRGVSWKKDLPTGEPPSPSFLVSFNQGGGGSTFRAEKDGQKSSSMTFGGGGGRQSQDLIQVPGSFRVWPQKKRLCTKVKSGLAVTRRSTQSDHSQDGFARSKEGRKLGTKIKKLFQSKGKGNLRNANQKLPGRKKKTRTTDAWAAGDFFSGKKTSTPQRGGGGRGKTDIGQLKKAGR